MAFRADWSLNSLSTANPRPIFGFCRMIDPDDGLECKVFWTVPQTRISVTGCAASAHLYDRAYIDIARRFCRPANAARQPIIIDMRRVSAGIAHQEYAIVHASRVRIGDIGVDALYPARKIGAHEQVENAIDGVGRHPLAALAADGIGNVIGRCRLFDLGQIGKDRLAHLGPLLARSFERTPRGDGKVFALVLVMLVGLVCDGRHGAYLRIPPAGCNGPTGLSRARA